MSNRRPKPKWVNEPGVFPDQRLNWRDLTPSQKRYTVDAYNNWVEAFNKNRDAKIPRAPNPWRGEGVVHNDPLLGETITPRGENYVPVTPANHSAISQLDRKQQMQQLRKIFTGEVGKRIISDLARSDDWIRMAEEDIEQFNRERNLTTPSTSGIKRPNVTEEPQSQGEPPVKRPSHTSRAPADTTTQPSTGS